MTFDSRTSDFDSPSNSIASEHRILTQFDGNRERCELLSAYLDGEVTASERQQVEQWLSEDTNFLDKYHHLLRLRDGMQALVPESANTMSAEATVQAVLTHSSRRSRQRSLKLGAVAAAITGLIAGSILSQTRLIPKVAQTSQPQPLTISAEPVVISLDQPIISLSSNATQPEQAE